MYKKCRLSLRPLSNDLGVRVLNPTYELLGRNKLSPLNAGLMAVCLFRRKTLRHLKISNVSPKLKGRIAFIKIKA